MVWAVLIRLLGEGQEVSAVLYTDWLRVKSHTIDSSVEIQ